MFTRYMSLVMASGLLASSVSAEKKYVQNVKLEPETSAEEVIQLAANVIPHERQLAYHEEEFIGFIHFGINTFTGKEWGNGKENPVDFNPTDLDTDQWCRVMKDAGMTKVIYTAKHHDGFCLWQTRYNNKFSVKASPWENGKGDVLKRLAKSAKKYGLKLGIYLSPADLYQIENEEGLYGNLSEYKDSVIPTAPESFKTNPLKRRKTAENLPTFKVKADDYNRYFMNQLYEVLTEYGKVDEVWFDGAHPKRKGGQKYLKTDWYAMIRKLQPSAVVFGGPDVRWCGNEHGGTRANEWNIMPIESLALSGLDRRPQDSGSDARLSKSTYSVYGKEYQRNELNYMISEVDTSIRHGWFWRNDTEQHVRPADEMFDIYERTVGGNAVFLLNVPPNKYGKFSPRDVKVMTEVGRRVRATYNKPLIESVNSGKGKVIDGQLETFWKASAINNSFEIVLSEKIRTNRFTIQEAITKVGQRVKSHALDAWIDGEWKEVSTAGVIGYKRTHRFATITTDKFRVRIIDSRAVPAIADVQAYFYKMPPRSVASDRDGSGRVTLKLADPKYGVADISAEPEKIIYTLNGEEPGKSKETMVYNSPIELPLGGMVRARSVSGKKYGSVSTKVYGICSQNWNVSATSGQTVANAFDNDPSTYWLGEKSGSDALVVDMKRSEKVGGFSYLPKKNKSSAEGLVEVWKVERSNDGKSWKSVEEVTFGNLKNDPSERIKYFKNDLETRYLRFSFVKGVAGNNVAGAASIAILSDKYSIK